MSKKTYRVGLCKRYWKYITIEAETERDAAIEARRRASKESVRTEVDDFIDYSNPVEVDDIIEQSSATEVAL